MGTSGELIGNVRCAWRLISVEFHRLEEGREGKATHRRCARITFSRLSFSLISSSPLASCQSFTALVIALDRSFSREIWLSFDGILVSWKVRACGVWLVDAASYRVKHFSNFFWKAFLLVHVRRYSLSSCISSGRDCGLWCFERKQICEVGGKFGIKGLVSLFGFGLSVICPCVDFCGRFFVYLKLERVWWRFGGI